MDEPDDVEFVLSMLPDLDIQPLIENSWVAGAMVSVGAGKIPKTQLEQLFLQLGFLYLAERDYSEKLKDENADLYALSMERRN